jgi:hypothetical protein
MSYLVTFGTGPTAIDQKPDLHSALAHACQLIADGHPNVTIQDGEGRRISGNDLVACCNGEKKLTSDLWAN